MGFSHSPKIVTDGLVLLLDAANFKSYPGSGTTWSDLSGNGVNCTLSSTEVSLVTSENVDVLYFNTGVSTITGPSTPDAFTLFTAFKKIGTQTDTFHVLMAGQTHEISIQNNSTFRVGTFAGGTRTTSDTSQATIGFDILDGRWTILTSRYDGSTLRSYVNGTQVRSVSKTGTTNDTYKLSRIGCWENNGYQANGYIPFTIMYDRALSADEIQQNYNALKGRFNI
jgi:hypothetical protein